jgi:hypothetical protein
MKYDSLPLHLHNSSQSSVLFPELKEKGKNFQNVVLCIEVEYALKLLRIYAAEPVFVNFLRSPGIDY